MKLMPTNEMPELESMIDAYGLSGVLCAIADIMNDKADHVRASYSDEVTAQTLEKCGAKVARTANEVNLF